MVLNTGQNLLDRKQFELDFPAINQVVYLNSAGQGPKPRDTIEKVAEYYKKTLLMGACVRPLLEEISIEVEKTRLKAADFFGADVKEIAFIRCVAEGVNTLLDGLELQTGDEIVTSYEENPAVLIPLHTFAAEKGLLIKKILCPNDKNKIIENLERAITERTRLVIVSHVSHTRGLKMPVKEMADVCHSRKVWLALDGAQAAGQVSVKMSELGCDCYLAAGYKWLLGLHGTTVAVMRRPLLESMKIRYNGVGSQSKFDFCTDEIRWKEDASRIEYGSRQWPLYIGLGESLNYLKKIGINYIEEHVKELRKQLKQDMRDLGFVCESPEEDQLSSGIVTFSKNGVDVERLTRWLFDNRRILVQYRNFASYAECPKGLRISLAFFTSKEELGQLKGGIADFLREGDTKIG